MAGPLIYSPTPVELDARAGVLVSVDRAQTFFLTHELPDTVRNKMRNRVYLIWEKSNSEPACYMKWRIGSQIDFGIAECSYDVMLIDGATSIFMKKSLEDKS